MIPLHEDDVCRLAEEWQIDGTLAVRLVWGAQLFTSATGRQLYVISGHRSCSRQEELKRQGRPATSCELSTHVGRPATGADLSMSPQPANTALKQAFGGAMQAACLRWGGGSAVGDDGIPSDWNHVDLGPRNS